MMKADGFKISIEQMRKDLGLRKKHYKAVKEFRDIEINPKTDNVVCMTKARKYEPKVVPVISDDHIEPAVTGIIVKEHIQASNRCKCGCYLHEHGYSDDGKVPCKKHRNCKDYEH